MEKQHLTMTINDHFSLFKEEYPNKKLVGQSFLTRCMYPERNRILLKKAANTRNYKFNIRNEI